MLLFGLTAFILGFTAVAPLADVLLIKRGLCQTCSVGLGVVATPRPPLQPCALAPEAPCPSTTSPSVRTAKLVSASVLFLWACFIWHMPLSHAGYVLAVLGLACMQTTVLCDFKARIIPWELSLVACVFGTLFSLVEYGASELALSLGLALCALGVLETVRLLARRCGRPEPIGAGDLRLLPALFLFCGCAGSICGAFAASVVMGLWAAVALVRHRSREAPQALPMAPGFSIWFLVGTACALS